MNSLQIVQETPVIELISEENSIVLDVLTINSSSTDAITLQGNDSAYHLNRANHTGSQPIDSVSGLDAALFNLSDADSHLAAEIVAIENTLPLKADLVGGVIPSSQIPAVAITELLKLSGGALPASEAEMLMLRGQIGDFTIRTDQSTTYFIASGDGSVLSDWIALPQAASPVLSVNGQTGAVVLGRADIGINSSDDIPEGVSNLYWGALRTRDTTLTGFSATNSAIISTDSIVQAFGKAQGQINALAEATPAYLFSQSNKTIRSVGTALNSTLSAFGSNLSFDEGFLQLNDILEFEFLIKTAGAITGTVQMRLSINGGAQDIFWSLNLNADATVRLSKVRLSVIVDYLPNNLTSTTPIFYANDNGTTRGTITPIARIISSSDPSQALTLNFNGFVGSALTASSDFLFLESTVTVKRNT